MIDDPSAQDVADRIRKAVFLEELHCSVERFTYDFTTKVALLWLPPLCCTDMTGAIAFVMRIDQDVQEIITMAGLEPDTRYQRNGTAWRAFRR